MLVLRRLAGRWIGGAGSLLIGLSLVGATACDGTTSEEGPPPVVVETPTSQPAADMSETPPSAAEMTFPGNGGRDEEAQMLLDWESLGSTPLQGWPGMEPDRERLLGAPLIVTEEDTVILQRGTPPFGVIPTDAWANSMPIPLYVARPGDVRLLEPWSSPERRVYQRRTETRRSVGDASEVPTPQLIQKWTEQLERLQKQLPPDVLGPKSPDDAEQ